MVEVGALGTDSAVLFDLDGTLVDTAPDMYATLCDMCSAAGRRAPEYDRARSVVSNGAIALLNLVFSDRQEEMQDLYRQYLDTYATQVCVNSRVFPGLHEVLDALERQRRPWGIVTNKPEGLTLDLLDGLGLRQRTASIVGGDTLAQRKPHPAPLHFAAEQMGVASDDCVYVGDNSRDIEAGKAAGMFTIAAAWGYIVDDDDPLAWNADALIASSHDLAATLMTHSSEIA